MIAFSFLLCSLQWKNHFTMNLNNLHFLIEGTTFVKEIFWTCWSFLFQFFHVFYLIFVDSNKIIYVDSSSIESFITTYRWSSTIWLSYRTFAKFYGGRWNDLHVEQRNTRNEVSHHKKYRSIIIYVLMGFEVLACWSAFENVRIENSCVIRYAADFSPKKWI